MTDHLKNSSNSGNTRQPNGGASSQTQKRPSDNVQEKVQGAVHRTLSNGKK